MRLLCLRNSSSPFSHFLCIQIKTSVLAVTLIDKAESPPTISQGLYLVHQAQSLPRITPLCVPLVLDRRLFS